MIQRVFYYTDITSQKFIILISAFFNGGHTTHYLNGSDFLEELKIGSKLGLTQTREIFPKRKSKTVWGIGNAVHIDD